MTSFSLKRISKSIQHAFDGLLFLFKNEKNAHIHLLAICLVIIFSFVFHIDTYEWCIVLICIAAVVGCEAINSAIEILCDYVCKERHDKIKRIKDLAAGATLCFAFISFLCACIIFIPKIYSLFI